MKNYRIVAIDDSPFSRGQAKCLLVGVVSRRDVVEGILSTRVEVDGTDGTRKISEMISRSRFAPQIRCIILNGIMVGGFNVVDIGELNEELGIPVIALTRKKPNKGAAETALKKHFKDWRERVERVRHAGEGKKHKKAYMQIAGISAKDAGEIIDVYGLEPLRLANMIASGIAKGESRGRI